MPWEPLHTVTLAVVRATTGPPDVDGVPTSAETTQSWGPCHVWPLSTAEQTGGVERATDRLGVSGPVAAWISHRDKVTYDSREWRVEGTPSTFTAVRPHTELTLVAWKGA